MCVNLFRLQIQSKLNKYNNFKNSQAKMGSKNLPVCSGVDRSSVNKTSNGVDYIPSCVSTSCKFSHTESFAFIEPAW